MGYKPPPPPAPQNETTTRGTPPPRQLPPPDCEQPPEPGRLAACFWFLSIFLTGLALGFAAGTVWHVLAQLPAPGAP